MMRRSIAVLLLGSLTGFATTSRAQSAGGGASASVHADWLQANDLPFTRKATPSAAAALEFRRKTWSLEVGWLRAARSLSTVQGGFVGLGFPIHLGSVVFLPGVAAFGGVANVSRDTTGYDWVTTSPVASGHQPRYDFSSGAAFGGGATLSIEYPTGSPVGIRVSGSEWMFGGTPLSGDRTRALVGVGLVVRFGLATRAAIEPARKPEPRTTP